MIFFLKEGRALHLRKAHCDSLEAWLLLPDEEALAGGPVPPRSVQRHIPCHSVWLRVLRLELPGQSSGSSYYSVGVWGYRVLGHKLKIHKQGEGSDRGCNSQAFVQSDICRCKAEIKTLLSKILMLKYFMSLRRSFMSINLFSNFYMERYIHWWLTGLKCLSPFSRFILIFIRCYMLSSTAGFTAWLMLVDRLMLSLTYLYENLQNSFNWFFYIFLPHCLFCHMGGTPYLH